MFGRGKEGSRTGRAVVGLGAVVALGLFATAPVIGDGLNSRPDPAPIMRADTHLATSVQIAAARGLAGASATRAGHKRGKKKKSRRVPRKLTIRSRITNQEILTEEGKGTFVGIRCPDGSKAISGGVLTKYINLLASSSSPNHPMTGKYSPKVWWLTVTNVNVDGEGGTLPWRGVVNCVSPARIKVG